MCTSLRELVVMGKNLPEKDNAEKFMKSHCKNPRNEKIRASTITSDELKQKSTKQIHEHFLLSMESFREITLQ